MLLLVKSLVIIFSLAVFLKLVYLFRTRDEAALSWAGKWRVMLAGFVANIADTLGIGSFAVILAFNKTWKMSPLKQLPGMMNCQSILPTMVQSFLFLKFVEMDLLTLIVFVIGACCGGVIGAFLVVRLKTQKIRLGMMVGFAIIAILVFGSQIHLFSLAGNRVALDNEQLIYGFMAMLIAGSLPAFGVGLYAPIQVTMFFLGMSPIVAFPIMTTVGAFVQTATALSFALKGDVPLKRSTWMGGAGVIGVFVAVPLVTVVDSNILRWLLLAIIIYNFYIISRSYFAKQAIT